MKVKIGDKIYDPDNEPVMVILSKQDVWNIIRSKPPADGNDLRYCSYPNSMSKEEVEKFMFVEDKRNAEE